MSTHMSLLDIWIACHPVLSRSYEHDAISVRDLCGILWRKILFKPCRLNCDKERGGHVTLRGDSEAAALSLPGESKCSWCFILTGKAFVKAFVINRSVAASKLTEATLIYSSRETTILTVAKIKSVTWLSLSKSIIILQKPSSLFTGQTGWYIVSLGRMC